MIIQNFIKFHGAAFTLDKRIIIIKSVYNVLILSSLVCIYTQSRIYQTTVWVKERGKEELSLIFKTNKTSYFSIIWYESDTISLLILYSILFPLFFNTNYRLIYFALSVIKRIDYRYDAHIDIALKSYSLK